VGEARGARSGQPAARGGQLAAPPNRSPYPPSSLCKLPGRMTPGTCRVCIVDINGHQKAACCTPVFEGAVVRSDTPEVRGARSGWKTAGGGGTD
jgi:predicted molibdopterin-dependent oxidoreductase YjgC